MATEAWTLTFGPRREGVSVTICGIVKYLYHYIVVIVNTYAYDVGMGLYPALAEQLAADRMHDRRREAERHRSASADIDGSAEVAETAPRRTRAVTRLAGQLLIAIGLRLTGDDRAGLTLTRSGTGHSAA